MKHIITIILIFITLLSFSQTNPNHVYVSGYYRSNGTYVKGYYRTAPNSTNRDNFSTRGNVNPYTGEPGYITPDNKGISTYNSDTYINYTNTHSASKTYNPTNNSYTNIAEPTNNTTNNSTITTATMNDVFDIDVSKIYSLPVKYVSATKANLRLGPTTTTNVLTTIDQNEKIRIIDNTTYTSWTKIIVSEGDGFFIGYLSNSLISNQKMTNDDQEYGPTEVVKSFLHHLSNEEFYDAFLLTNNPSWNKNGGYKWFSSTDAYGGIDYIIIYEVRLENAYTDQAVVFADYYASDPLHTSKRWKQILILEYQYSEWKIVRVKLAE